MDKFLNEALFDIVLEKAFIEHEKEEFKSYPDDDELEKKYPISKKEIRKLKKVIKEKEYGKKLIRVYLEKAAVVILCVISVFFALIMTSSEVRASVENVILKWYDKYTEIVLMKNDDYNNGLIAEKVEDVQLGYIPDGFELILNQELKSKRLLQYINIYNEESLLSVDIFVNDSESISFDNEQVEYERLDSSSGEMWIMYNDNEKYGGLIVVGINVSVLITGDLSKEELIKIAENIK